MNLKLISLVNLSLFLIFSVAIYFLWKENLKLKNDRINIVNNEKINWGKGWNNKQSKYSGSELRFTVVNNKSISLKVSVPNPEPIQEMEITVEGKAFYLSSPDLEKKELTIHLKKESFNNPQEVRIRSFCTYQYIPCNVSIESIIVDGSAKLLSPPNLPKTLSVLGDSISTNFGSQNFTRYLADHLGYQLHNASVFHSTISKTEGISGISRLKKDVLDFKPNYVVVFLGTNDILENVSLNEFKQSYKAIVERLKKDSPKSKVILAGIIKSKALDPNTVDEFNETIQQVGASEHTIYIDTSGWLHDEDYMDSIHPSIQAQIKLEAGFFDVISKITD